MAGEIETLDLIGDLPTHWKVARFGEVLEGGTRNGIYKTKEFHGSGAKVVNMGELFANPRLRDVPMKRVQLSEAEIDKSSLKTGDLLFARRSLVAEGAGKCIVVSEVKEPTTFESSIIRARPNSKKVDSLFLYYLFNSPYGAYVLLTIRRQVAVSGITGADLVELPIPLPPLAEQKAIAAVLGSLDDKIELNRRMNATLEAMPRALFQSWFVDFDPVRAKLNGRPPAGVDAVTAALFSDSFQDSPIGPIPREWEVGRLDDVLTLQRGFDLPTPDRTHGTYPVMAANGPNGCHDKFMVRGPGVTTGRSGVLGSVFFIHGDFWPLNTSLWVKEFKRVSPAYAFHLLRGLDFEMFNAGSAVPTLNRNHVHNLPVVMPPTPIVEAFDAQVMPLMKQQKANVDQSATLATLRDTLLPKLLRGELRVHGVESRIAEVLK
jgi:type I restriction enzyme S subunit